MGQNRDNLNCLINEISDLIQQTATRGRFAPSPSGPLHFGSIVAALGSYLFAKANHGIWLIRVEDVDHDRCDAITARQQLEHLELLGLHSDESVEWQSANSARYERELTRLLASGDAFECRCSRTDIAGMGGVHHACVSKPADAPAGIRLRVPPDTVIGFADHLCGEQVQDVHTEVGDFLLRRADGQWTYQFAVVVDDHAQRINQVVRGADLLDSTARQILLQQTLGYATPDYAHLPLLLDSHGRKLSKSDNDPAAVQASGGDSLKTLALAWQTLRQARLSAATPQQFLERSVQLFDPECLRQE